jgi:hypothetical protein
MSDLAEDPGAADRKALLAQGPRTRSGSNMAARFAGDPVAQGEHN